MHNSYRDLQLLCETRCPSRRRTLRAVATTTVSSRYSKGSCDPHTRLKVEVTGIRLIPLADWLFADIGTIRIFEAGGYSVESSRASRRQRKRLSWTRAPRSNGTLAHTGEKWEKCQPRKLPAHRSDLGTSSSRREQYIRERNSTSYILMTGRGRATWVTYRVCISRGPSSTRPETSSWCDPHLMRLVIESR